MASTYENDHTTLLHYAHYHGWSLASISSSNGSNTVASNLAYRRSLHGMFTTIWGHIGQRDLTLYSTQTTIADTWSI